MRFALLTAFCALPLPALAECEYRTAFNYMTGRFEEAPISCTHQPAQAARSTAAFNAQSWRECPVHEEIDRVSGQPYRVRVCDPNVANP
jgi:hypothetical protein